MRNYFRGVIKGLKCNVLRSNSKTFTKVTMFAFKYFKDEGDKMGFMTAFLLTLDVTVCLELNYVRKVLLLILANKASNWAVASHK